jgi:hypothetical protein
LARNGWKAALRTRRHRCGWPADLVWSCGAAIARKSPFGASTGSRIPDDRVQLAQARAPRPPRRHARRPALAAWTRVVASARLLATPQPLGEGRVRNREVDPSRQPERADNDTVERPREHRHEKAGDQGRCHVEISVLPRPPAKLGASRTRLILHARFIGASGSALESRRPASPRSSGFVSSSRVDTSRCPTPSFHYAKLHSSCTVSEPMCRRPGGRRGERSCGRPLGKCAILSARLFELANSSSARCSEWHSPPIFRAAAVAAHLRPAPSGPLLRRRWTCDAPSEEAAELNRTSNRSGAFALSPGCSCRRPQPPRQPFGISRAPRPGSSRRRPQESGSG